MLYASGKTPCRGDKIINEYYPIRMTKLQRELINFPSQLLPVVALVHNFLCPLDCDIVRRSSTFPGNNHHGFTMPKCHFFERNSADSLPRHICELPLDRIASDLQAYISMCGGQHGTVRHHGQYIYSFMNYHQLSHKTSPIYNISY